VGVGVCAGDHYDNHTDHVKTTAIYPPTPSQQDAIVVVEIQLNSLDFSVR